MDLKTLLEEVQSEVKREESKRSELQLQYTEDQCAWELEKAELKYRIAQVRAARGACGLMKDCNEFLSWLRSWNARDNGSLSQTELKP